MNKSEQIALRYLLKQGYNKSDIDFNSGRVIDFVCSDGKSIEVKTLRCGKYVVFSANQWSLFHKQNPHVLIVERNKVIGIFPFDSLTEIGFHTQGRKAHPELTTIQISFETKKRIDGYKRHPRATNDEVINWILDKLVESDEEIIELNKKLEHKKEDY